MGELLQHEILSSLKGSSSEWLINLLGAFNCGDIETFKSTQAAWNAQPDLKVIFIFQKFSKKFQFFFWKTVLKSILESCETIDWKNVPYVLDGNDICATGSW